MERERSLLGMCESLPGSPACPPDRVPQTPAGGLRPPVTCPPDRVPPTEELLLSLNTKKLIKKIYQAASNPRY